MGKTSRTSFTNKQNSLGSTRSTRSKNYTQFALGSAIIMGSLAAFGIYIGMTKPEQDVQDVQGAQSMQQKQGYNQVVKKSVKLINEHEKWTFSELKEGGYDKNKYNIAIYGPSLSGKSTIFNTIMKINKGDTVYKSSEIPSYSIEDSNHVLWDFPGWGTPQHRFENYSSNRLLSKFKKIILTYTSVLGPDTINMYRECVRSNILVLLVRTKADETLQEMMERGIPKEQAIIDMRKNFEKECKELDLHPTTKTFCVAIQEYTQSKSKNNGEMDEAVFISEFCF